MRDLLPPYIPAVVLFPLLFAKIPISVHAAREIAGYFQTLAYIRDGPMALFYLTPAESYSSIHLHSILSAPLVALGYVEGGRLISLLAAVISVSSLYWIGKEFGTRRLAYLAPAFLWVQPMFIRHSYAYQPDTLSIALTTGTLYATLQYVRDGRDKWFYAGLALLIVAPTNHMWEATVLLPMVALLVWNSDDIRAGLCSVAALGSVAIVKYLTSLQPSSSLSYYSTLSAGLDVFVTPEFWLSHLDFYLGLPGPNGLAITFTLPLSIIFAVYWGRRAFSDGDLLSVLLSSWLASGLSIPFLMAQGYIVHYYYLWGLLAPFALSLAVAADAVLTTARVRYGVPPDRLPDHTVAYGLLAGAIVYILLFQLTIFAGTGVPVVSEMPGERMHVGDYDAVEAGQWVGKNDIEASEVMLTGEWPKGYNGLAGRVFVYSGHLIKERGIQSPGGPAMAQSGTSDVRCASLQGTGYEVIVHRSDSGVSVIDCR